MTEDRRSRPYDALVEPLFAGLGVEESPPAAPRARRSRAAAAGLVLIALALLAWWLV